MNFNERFGLALRGMAMGIAEVIPGVSGGTIAFITGIYEKLINTIKAFSPSLIKTFKNDGVGGVWSAVNGNFLISLMVGMAVGIVVGVFGVTHLLENYPQHLWGFFFGLIVASAIYIGRQVPKWSIKEVIGLLIGIAVAYYITVASPAQGNTALWYVFFSGMIAISALILPGISGSFILLLMGMYTVVLPEVRNALSTFETESLILVSVFAMGCLVGITTISRVLSWMFQNYNSLTLATLTGFMIGSLNKVWPWRNVLSERLNSKGKMVPFLEESVLPNNFDGTAFILPVLVLMVVGFASVFVMERLGGEKH